jgi:hypothetical protein
VSAHTGYLLTAFSLQEQGGYTGEIGSAHVSGYLGALDIEGSTNLTQSSLSTFLQPTYDAGSWSATAGVTLPGTGWGGADGIVSSASLAISNQLFAGDGSSIYKDFVGITVVTAPVPEAQTYALMLAGLGLVGFMARRRRSASA